MSIEEKTVWTVGLLQFDSHEEAERHCADRVGEFMDRAPLVLGPGDRIKLNNFMHQNRAAIRKLLDY